jgi:hypothetical protein
MKNKGKVQAQFSLTLSHPVAGPSANNVVTGRFKISNPHLDAVTRRLTGSGVFAAKSPPKK